MKRKFKKALSIAVAASLALSMPVSAMAEETTELSSGTEGAVSESGALRVMDGETVEKTGDITVKDDNGVTAINHSKVTVNGNVTVEGENPAVLNSMSDIKVTGNVKIDDQKPSNGEKFASFVNQNGNTEIGGNVESGASGVYVENGSTSVNGKITATQNGVYVAKYNANNTDNKQDANVSVGNGITVTEGFKYEHSIQANAVDIRKGTSEGKVNVQLKGDINATAKANNDVGNKYYDDIISNGVRIYNLSGNAKVDIDGSIKVKAERDKLYNDTRAEGIYISSYFNENSSGDHTQKTDVTMKGNIDATADRYSSGIHLGTSQGTTNVKLDGNITSIADDGIGIGVDLRGGQKNSVSNVIINGDVKGSRAGLRISDFDGKANVVVNGTLSGQKAILLIKETITDKEENGEVVTNKYGYERESDITVWSMDSTQKNLVSAVEYIEDNTKENPKDRYKELGDVKTAEEVLKNINYIIRTDKVDNGTIKLSNTRLISGFDTARETEEIIINVQASDGYKVDSVKNGDAVLKRNADGTYTLTVPRGGGVQLSAVLSAIQKSQSSSSGSSGSSSSSRPGVTSTNVQTIPSVSGATVATTTSDSNGTHNTNAVVKIADKQATVSTSEQTGNGNSIIIRNVSGDVAGATFTGVGTVSTDGKSIATTDGQVHAVTQAPMLVIKTGDQSVGCFVDLTTGAPLATGKTEVYYQLGADGQMYAHWVNPMGFFYTGTVVMNGHTITFNEQGVMIDVR